jgi:hypothetical protein
MSIGPLPPSNSVTSCATPSWKTSKSSRVRFATKPWRLAVTVTGRATTSMPDWNVGERSLATPAGDSRGWAEGPARDTESTARTGKARPTGPPFTAELRGRALDPDPHSIACQRTLQSTFRVARRSAAGAGARANAATPGARRWIRSRSCGGKSKNREAGRAPGGVCIQGVTWAQAGGGPRAACRGTRLRGEFFSRVCTGMRTLESPRASVRERGCGETACYSARV